MQQAYLYCIGIHRKALVVCTWVSSRNDLSAKGQRGVWFRVSNYESKRITTVQSVGVQLAELISKYLCHLVHEEANPV